MQTDIKRDKARVSIFQLIHSLNMVQVEFNKQLI